MTQEDKELLLKDLSARLPYGVICYWRIGSELTLNLTEYNGLLTCLNKVNIEGSNEFYWDCYFDCNDSNGNSFQNEDVQIDIVKPYLRPMSSMTTEERQFLLKFGTVGMDENDKVFDVYPYGIERTMSVIDFLNACHFDYRGLIEKGLALEAPEGMYNLNEK